MDYGAGTGGSKARTDRVFLAGPHSRTTDLWLVLRALRDFIFPSR